jgi:hypothetical protein
MLDKKAGLAPAFFLIQNPGVKIGKERLFLFFIGWQLTRAAFFDVGHQAVNGDAQQSDGHDKEQKTRHKLT